MLFRDDAILPDPPAGAIPVLHNREYRVESYYLAADRLLIQGALRDQKPPGQYIPGDPDPLTIHHMTVGIEVSLPDLVIEDVRTEFPTHPQPTCTAIIDHYDSLVGLSISRGFTHRVRELFGGPRGCSHTTALLQAMAPIAMQSLKGMAAAQAEAEGRPHPMVDPTRDDSWKRLVNTCHVWAEGGERITQAKEGGAAAQTMVVLHRREQLDQV